ncbi:MAG: S8 family peptidase [Anaerolineae bacterium]|nr:S8 family peptidase [Anaerolineae bacterium]
MTKPTLHLSLAALIASSIAVSACAPVTPRAMSTQANHLALTTPAQPAAQASFFAQAVRLHPDLVALAKTSATDRVRVIVQQAEAGDAAEKAVADFGGTIADRLSMINALVVEISASGAYQLAQHPAVRWVSPDAPVEKSAAWNPDVNVGNLKNAFNASVKATNAWDRGLTGKGVTIAQLDSGVSALAEVFDNRILATATYSGTTGSSGWDYYGHGSHVSGIMIGSGKSSGGKYIGMAPEANLVSVRVSENDGTIRVSNVISGMQWLLANKTKYNIRAVNISLNSSVMESYLTSPLCAAAEILWFNGIVVVTSAGNAGTKGALYPPANDPFVITVGAVDDKGTTSITDDTMATFSAYGTTLDGVVKPDLVAPGVKIVGGLASLGNKLSMAHPENVVDSLFFRMSGTSMAAPVVTGAVALLLQDEPNLTPDQVKYRLTSTANKTWKGYNKTKAGAGYLDIDKAIGGTSTAKSNTNVKYNTLIVPVGSVLRGLWDSVSWTAVSWTAVSWTAVSWTAVSWTSAADWNSTIWGD